MFKTSAERSAARKSAIAANAGLLRNAYAKIVNLEEQLRCLLEAFANEDLRARIIAMMPCLVAQRVAAKDGLPAHSSRQLVTPDRHVLANAARHLFSPTKCFSQVTPGDARKSQRGGKASSMPPPPPPAFDVGYDAAILCSELEKFRESLYGISQQAVVVDWSSFVFVLDEAALQEKLPILFGLPTSLLEFPTLAVTSAPALLSSTVSTHAIINDPAVAVEVDPFDSMTDADLAAAFAAQIYDISDDTAYKVRSSNEQLQLSQHTISIAEKFVYAWECRLCDVDVKAAFIIWLNFWRATSAWIVEGRPCAFEHDVCGPELPLQHVARFFHVSHLVTKAFGFWIALLAHMSYMRFRFWASGLHVRRLLTLAFRTWHSVWSMGSWPPPPLPALPLGNAYFSDRVNSVNDRQCNFTIVPDRVGASVADKNLNRVHNTSVVARSSCTLGRPYSEASSVSDDADRTESDRLCYERLMADPIVRVKFHRMLAKQRL